MTVFENTVRRAAGLMSQPHGGEKKDGWDIVGCSGLGSSGLGECSGLGV